MANEEGEEELNEVNEQLDVEKSPKNGANNEKTEVEEITTSKNDVDQELNNLKKSLENATQELKIKEETIQSLKCEVDKLKELKSTISEKDTLLHATKKELDVVQASMARTKRALCDNKKRVDELQVEVERRKVSESKLNESFIAQRNQLEEMNEMVEKYKVEVVEIREEMQSKQEEAERDTSVEDLDEGNDFDDDSRSDVKSLVDEIRVLKKELKRAMEAEENSNKAMDDLALALKEVVSESQKTNDKLQSREEQLEQVKEQLESLKRIAESTEQKYETVLKDSKKENDQLKNTVSRLKKEAEESLLAWSEKEIEFVNCIKIAETDKDAAQQQNKKLVELVKHSEEISVNSKEENRKLRDILGQALNEANMAKEAANIAKEENSYLKDTLAEKDKALVSLAQETERLRINESEANERIIELKRIIVSGSKKEAAKIEKENKELKKLARKDSMSDNNDKDSTTKERRTSGSFSFDLHQLWPTATKASKEGDEDHHHKDDALGGSIFDLVESPGPTKEPPVQKHYRRTASACSDEGKSLMFEHFDGAEHFDDMEIERHNHGKRNKALLKRFGDLLKRKNNHPPHPQKDSPKEIQPPPPPKEVQT